MLLVDGRGQPEPLSVVHVRGERIERIGCVSDQDARGLRIFEGGGRVMAPGFIDLHTLATRSTRRTCNILRWGARSLREDVRPAR